VKPGSDPSDVTRQIIEDNNGMTEAIITQDWDEARFRCQLIAGHAAEAGFTAAGLAAVAMRASLGVFGSQPGHGYGNAMLKLADEVDALAFNRPI